MLVIRNSNKFNRILKHQLLIQDFFRLRIFLHRASFLKSYFVETESSDLIIFFQMTIDLYILAAGSALSALIFYFLAGKYRFQI